MGNNFSDYGNAELLEKQVEDFESRLAPLLEDALADDILIPAIVVGLAKAQAAMTLSAIPRIMDAVNEGRKAGQ